MKNKRLIIDFAIIAILVLAAFAPWLTKSYAEKRAVHTLNGNFPSITGVTDGCGVGCPGCGVIASKKVAFGYSVKVEYSCGPLGGASDSRKYNQVSDRFVSFFGVVF